MQIKQDRKYPIVLAIAGSEPLGSAGVQADIKSISACGGYAAGALTCIVNENTTEVKDIFSLPVDLVTGQVESFLGDLDASAIKMGMLYSAELIEKLSVVLKKYSHIPLIVDPVMVASGGEQLIENSAVEAYKKYLFPLATIITPNRREAELLLGKKVTIDSAEKDATAICQWGNSVIIKSIIAGDDKLEDAFCDVEDGTTSLIMKEYVETRNINGTGCTFSSSIATFLARGFNLKEAISRAEEYINGAIVSGARYEFGKGIGPVDHFYKFNAH